MIYVHGKKDGIKRKKRPKDKKFQCAICDKIFSDDYNLNCHVKSVHHKIRDHCCEKCGKRFSIAQSLKKHDIRSHGGIDGGRILYKCDYCIGGKPFKGPGLMEIHLRLTHKIEGPLNIKPEGFNEKMAKRVNKLYCRLKKSEMPPEFEDDTDENLEKKFPQNSVQFEEPKIALSFGSYESSVSSINTNEKQILGDLNFMPMRNPEHKDDQIDENYIETSDYATDKGNVNTDEPDFDECENQYMENEDFDNSNDTAFNEKEDSKPDLKDEDRLEKSYSEPSLSELLKYDELSELQEISHVPNNEVIEVQDEPLKMNTQIIDKVDVSEKPINNSNSGTSSEEEQKFSEALKNLYENLAPSHKDKHSFAEALKNMYENLVQTNKDEKSYSSSSSEDEENHEQPPETEDEENHEQHPECKDEENHEQPPEINSNESEIAIPVLEEMGNGLQLQEVKVELEEPGEAEQSKTDDEIADQEWHKKFKLETSGTEIRIDENEVITNRFGHIVDKKIKCNYCDKIYIGKWAAKSIWAHCRRVHGAPKLKEAKNEVTNEHLENSDTNVQKCKFCDKSYVGIHALDSMKYHMKSHSGLHYICHICEKDFLHKLGRLVWHLEIKHQCENVCDKCK